jgi:hypothetical protein
LNEIDLLPSSFNDTNSRVKRKIWEEENTTKKRKVFNQEENAKLQDSYLICCPSGPDHIVRFKEHSLGSYYSQTPEKEMFGRTFGLNWQN